MLRAVPMLVSEKPISSPYFETIFPSVLARSFVGVFGAMNVYLPEWLYKICALMAVIGVLGFFLSVMRRAVDKRVAIVLIVLPLLSIGATVQLNLTFTQPQGRYLFPALTAFMVLIAIGLSEPFKLHRNLTYWVVAVCIAINLYALIGSNCRRTGYQSRSRQRP